MKTFINIITLVIALSFAGCWDMYNDVADDMDEAYQFFLATTNNDTSASTLNVISIFPLISDGMLIRSFKQNAATENDPFYVAAHPTGNFLYATSNHNGTSGTGLFMYQVQNDGSLVSLGTATTGTNPYSLKVHPSGKFVYVSNQGSDTISVYQVNINGTLTELTGSPYSSHCTGPTRIVIDPSGSYLFVASTTNTIAVLSINSDGSLIQSIPSYSGAATSGIIDIVTDQKGHIYLTSNGGIYLYSMPSTFKNVYPSTYTKAYLTVHPSDKFLYAADYFSGKFYSFQIIADGSLINLNIAGTTSDVREIVVHPNGHYLYTAHRGGGRIDSFIINADGTIQDSVYQTISTNDYHSSCGLAIIRKKIK
jgi:6-phosphogluconolactonase